MQKSMYPKPDMPPVKNVKKIRDFLCSKDHIQIRKRICYFLFISCVFAVIVYNKPIRTVMIPRATGQKTTSQGISPDGGIVYG